MPEVVEKAGANHQIASDSDEDSDRSGSEENQEIKLNKAK